MKKRLLIGFISLFMIFGVSSTCLALNSVAGTSDLGSLLIWPKVVLEGPFGGVDVDTVITITNTANRPQDIRLKCYWVYRVCAEYECIEYDNSGNICLERDYDSCIDWDCENKDFSIDITHNQPVWFDARTGYGEPVNVRPFPEEADERAGELKCWVVDANEVAIRFNRLKGHANIFVGEPVYAAAKYNAWVFQARNNAGEGARMGYASTDARGNVSRVLELTGRASSAQGSGWYYACPKYLHFNFFAAGGHRFDGEGIEEAGGFTAEHRYSHTKILANDIAIVPCKQDLTNGGGPTVTKLEMDVWNADEVKVTGAWDCLDCFYERLMGDIDDGFTYWVLKDKVAHARIWSASEADCDTDEAISTVTGLLGVHLEGWAFFHRCTDDLDGRKCMDPALTATTPIPQSRIRTDTITYNPNP